MRKQIISVAVLALLGMVSTKSSHDSHAAATVSHSNHKGSSVAHKVRVFEYTVG
jgi:hypothetical protein